MSNRQLAKQVKKELKTPISHMSVKRIKDSLKNNLSSPVTKVEQPEVLQPEKPIETINSEELLTYREEERTTLLQEIPDGVIKEYKLLNKPLEEIKKIHTITQALKKKKSVGIDTPAPTTVTKELKFQWSIEHQKNMMC